MKETHQTKLFSCAGIKALWISINSVNWHKIARIHQTAVKHVHPSIYCCVSLTLYVCNVLVNSYEVVSILSEVEKSVSCRNKLRIPSCQAVPYAWRYTGLSSAVGRSHRLCVSQKNFLKITKIEKLACGFKSFFHEISLKFNEAS